MPLDPTQPRLAMPVTDRDHTMGPPDAPVTLVEYGDYECPDCGNAYPEIKRLIAEFGPRLRFVFRNFPLYSLHPHAGYAAMAAEAAAAQGKFWPMHDLLYENQKNLAAVEITHLALRAGVEIYKFQAEFGGEVYANRVSEDFTSGQQSGVTGTPTFFVNEIRYVGEKDYASLKAAIESAL